MRERVAQRIDTGTAKRKRAVAARARHKLAPKRAVVSVSAKAARAVLVLLVSAVLHPVHRPVAEPFLDVVEGLAAVGAACVHEKRLHKRKGVVRGALAVPVPAPVPLVWILHSVSQAFASIGRGYFVVDHKLFRALRPCTILLDHIIGKRDRHGAAPVVWMAHTRVGFTLR